MTPNVLLYCNTSGEVYIHGRIITIDEAIPIIFNKLNLIYSLLHSMLLNTIYWIL